MSLNQNELDRIKKKLSDTLVRQVVKNMLIKGVLGDDDLNNTDVFREKLHAYAKNLKIVAIGADRTDELLKTASEFADIEQLDLAILLYATYFEHVLNSIISEVLRANKVSNKSKNELLRAASIGGKCGWVLEVLGLPVFNKNHAKFIVGLAEERNSFVHYKWNLTWDMVDDSSNKKKEMINSAKKTATYVKQYTAKVLFKGKKGKLYGMLK